MHLKITYVPGILKLEKKETEKMILFFGGYFSLLGLWEQIPQSEWLQE